MAAHVVVEGEADLAAIPVDLDGAEVRFPEDGANAGGIGWTGSDMRVLGPREVERRGCELEKRIAEVFVAAVVGADMAVAGDDDDAVGAADEVEQALAFGRPVTPAFETFC